MLVYVGAAYAFNDMYQLLIKKINMLTHVLFLGSLFRWSLVGKAQLLFLRILTLIRVSTSWIIKPLYQKQIVYRGKFGILPCLALKKKKNHILLLVCCIDKYVFLVYVSNSCWMDYLWLLLDKWSDLQCNIPPYCACEYDREILYFVCTHIRLSIQVRSLSLSLSLTHSLTHSNFLASFVFLFWGCVKVWAVSEYMCTRLRPVSLMAIEYWTYWFGVWF